MKKIIFLTLALALTFVGTTWGQATDEHFEVTSVTINDNYPFVYDGTAKTYITSFVDNCSISDGNLMGNTATNAGDYTATISSICHGHPIDKGSYTYEEFHVGSVSYNWTILPRSISKTDYADYNVSVTVHNQKWTGSEIELAADVSDTDTKVYSIKFKGAELVKGTDYDVYTTIESSTGKIKDEGRYTIVFVGKGNFTGTITKTFEVKKQLTDPEATTGIHYAIPDQILTLNTTNSKYELKEFTMEVNDTKSHTILRETEDYTLKFFAGGAAVDDYLDSDPSNDPTPITLADITAEGKYWVVIEGKAPKYTAKVKKEFYAIKEYQLTATHMIDGGEAPQVSVRITKAGYPTYAPVGATAPVKGEVEVAMKPVINTDAATTFTPCIPIESNRCVIPAGYNMKAFLSTVFGSLTSEYTYDVVGIKNGVFAGCSKLRWIDVQIPAATWTPSSLDRDVINIDTPFCGVPKSAIVYLFGTTVAGENYVYKFGTDDYRCAQYRIYEDLSGEQTQYSK